MPSVGTKEVGGAEIDGTSCCMCYKESLMLRVCLNRLQNERKCQSRLRPLTGSRVWVKGLTQGLTQSIVSLPRDAAAAVNVCC